MLPYWSKVLPWYNLFAAVWIAQFCLAGQNLVIAGAVTTWFFARYHDALVFFSLSIVVYTRSNKSNATVSRRLFILHRLKRSQWSTNQESFRRISHYENKSNELATMALHFRWLQWVWLVGKSLGLSAGTNRNWAGSLRTARVASCAIIWDRRPWDLSSWPSSNSSNGYCLTSNQSWGTTTRSTVAAAVSSNHASAVCSASNDSSNTSIRMPTSK